jgi:O-antigen/teichoic acid export membrane protein
MGTNVIATVLVVGIAMILTPRYGLTGAAVSVLVYTVVRNVAKTYFLFRTIGMTALSLTLLRPLVAATVGSGLVAVIEGVTSLGASLAGTAALGILLIAVYALILVRFIGVSDADRRTLRLAFRPSAASPELSDPTAIG